MFLGSGVEVGKMVLFVLRVDIFLVRGGKFICFKVLVLVWLIRA